MTRSERRAAMRLTQKQQPVANTNTIPSAETVAETPASKSISPAQLAANQANAKLSTGPKTEAGRAICSMNAVKTGLTGRTLLIAPEDVGIYKTHLARFAKKFAPVTPEESELVQSIADTEWRRLRIVPLETGIYALGRREFADSFQDIEDLATRKAMVDVAVFHAYRKDLSNIALQETRLRNQVEASIAAFKTLKRERLAKAQTELEDTASAEVEIAVAVAANGFVFSTPGTSESEPSPNTETAINQVPKVSLGEEEAAA